MSTAISVRTETLPALARPPGLSGSLVHCIERLTDGDNPYRHHIQVDPADADEARARLKELNHMCRPAPEAVVRAWCAMLVPHLAKPPAQDEFPVVIDGMMLGCGDLPASVWTGETIGAMLKAATWWPAPALVRKVLLPFAEPLWRLRNGLDTVTRMARDAAPPSREVVTPEAKEHVASIVSAFVAERTFNAPSGSLDVRPPIKPHHGSDRALLAGYERIVAEGGLGAAAAATRAAMLRKRLA